MPCRYCGQDQKLVEAHILPRSFYAHLRSPGNVPILVPAAGDEHITKSRTGVYDPNILCGVCESRFSALDSYGKKFFVDTDWSTAPRHPQYPDHLIEIPDAKYTLLKLFALSVLLRAHWTTQPFFAHVDIGIHEQMIKGMIERRDAGDQAQYGTVIFKFHPTGTEVDPRLGWRNPATVRPDGVRFWKIWFLDFILTIKVDQRPLPDPFDKFALHPDRPVRVVTRDYMSSQELRDLVATTKGRGDADKPRRRSRTR